MQIQWHQSCQLIPNVTHTNSYCRHPSSTPWKLDLNAKNNIQPEDNDDQQYAASNEVIYVFLKFHIEQKDAAVWLPIRITDLKKKLVEVFFIYTHKMLVSEIQNCKIDFGD